MAFFDQSAFQARFEWGCEGAKELARTSRAIVVVDVLRFSTAVDAAMSRGATVYPYQWRDDSAQRFAREVGALLAGLKENAKPDNPFSLSPVSMASADAQTRIVLPSPNGAEVSLAADAAGATVLAGCLRNASAVASAALEIGLPLAVIAAGERWKKSGTFRPCFEDLIGAGAILDSLRLADSAYSPEAAAARAAFKAAASSLEMSLFGCSSGRELAERGFDADVRHAAMLDVSSTVPILRNHAFVRRST